VSENFYARLKGLLPGPVLLFGKVLSHDDVADTSTIELPTNLGVTSYSPGVAVGATVIARGRTVAVGDNAFVRAGVVESRAPSGEAHDIEIGTVVPTVTPPSALAFVGTFPGLTLTVGAAVNASLASFFTGGYPPLSFALELGTLPAGVTFNTTTGVFSGTPTAAVSSNLGRVKASDQTHVSALSNNFVIVCT
jgi:large repetitive protein